MTLMGAIGCGLVSFGPVGILFFLIVAGDPLQVILFTLSSFFWLLGLLVSSVIWFAVVPLREHLAFGLVVACLVQELMRFLFYLLISFSEAGLHKIAEYEAREASCSNSTGEPNTGVRIVNSSDDVHGSIFNNRKLAFSSGLSFALMGGIFEYIYILYDVIGPATLFEGTNPGYFFIFAALNSCFMGLMQISWSVILFRSFHLRLYFEIVVICLCHVAVSSLTLLNEWPYPAPEMVCITLAITSIGFFVYAFFAAGCRWPSRAHSHPMRTNPVVILDPTVQTVHTAIS
ncbi:unnamed protein product [Hymenolepis diminuta]|uniref:Gamma-secretase subunit Aph-1 n=1 Tax=Hymenolepis diminuta TaxID=6216 RepID=A0A564YVR3_HYMDI|nr:unnamed protein product [Hymenolepis diminuta]